MKKINAFYANVGADRVCLRAKTRANVSSRRRTNTAQILTYDMVSKLHSQPCQGGNKGLYKLPCSTYIVIVLLVAGGAFNNGLCALICVGICPDQLGLKGP